MIWPRIPFALYFPYSDWPDYTRTAEQLTVICRDRAAHGMTSMTFYPWSGPFEGPAERKRLIRCLPLAK